jgi:hypothetical protein
LGFLYSKKGIEISTEDSITVGQPLSRILAPKSTSNCFTEFVSTSSE